VNPTGRAFVDPSSPRAFAVCDRCGKWYNHDALQWQYEWAGTQLINLGALVCETCLDEPQIQLKTIILPPDPPPVLNARVEPFSLDESGPTQELVAEIVTDQSAIPPVFYLDLYDDDPTDGGTSILGALTGSATRTNYASVMTTVGAQATNTTTISITTSAETTATAAWVVIFDAATAGNMLMYGELEPPQTITEWNGAEFAVDGLVVLLAAPGRSIGLLLSLTYPS
jgi:hypothetical protein